jgi:tricorn protease
VTSVIVRTLVLSLFCAAGLVLAASPAAAQSKLLRFPDIHGDRVAFTHGGDLWLAPAAGGTATRLTSHPGLELFAKFSPDGKWLAFTGQYDGDEQVYVMPSTGGEPKQLTFYPARGPFTTRWGYDNQVYGWSTDGTRILFRSHRDGWTLPLTRLYTVAAAGGPAEPLPMPESGAGAYAPDGKQVVYSPRFRDFRSEKRYGGGQANDLFIFDLASHAATRITDHPRADRDPMWIGGTIYFNSDRSGTFNLYAYDVAKKTTTPVTTSTSWDVRWPSEDTQTGRIVYESNGELQLFDAKSGKAAAIAITVPDDGLARRPGRIPVGSQIRDVELSPKGERALFAARGDIFTAPIEKGPTRNLTRSSGAHDKWPRWSPDGRRIAFVSDMSGEDELYLVAQDGTGKPEALTKGGQAFRYAPAWSPDGTRIAFGDKDGRVYVVKVADKTMTRIVDAPRGQIQDYTWAPRGRHLAFSMNGANGFGAVCVWSEKDGQVRRVTDPLFNAGSPAWDPDGKYLFFTSDREFAPQLSTVEWNFATNRTTGIFAVALRTDVPHLFPPESDEVKIGDEKKDEPKADEKKPAEKQPESAKPAEAAKDDAKKDETPEAKKTTVPVPAGSELAIDFDGLAARVMRVPLPADNYDGLAATKTGLFYTVAGASYYGRDSDRERSLRIFAFKDRKETSLVPEMSGYALSADGSKLIVAQGSGQGSATYLTFDATPTGAGSKKTVSTAGLMYDRVPAEEWAQIFGEVWRRYRDFFYVDNMHGYDWVALRKQYEPLVAHVAHRADLNTVIAEMISELTVQHAYISGGDIVQPARARVALPGARLALDTASGKYRIARILTGQNEEERYRAPLTEVGVQAKVGDYVLAIDGEDLKPTEDPYRLLRNKADRPVTLTLNATPSATGARTVTFQPVASEESLLYLDWVQGNRRRVAELSKGRAAYLHVPDMGADGIREFIKWYYGQIDADALVVDVRANGGGNVSRMLIERLRRQVLALGFSRTDERANTYPDGVFRGPMVAILNENSSSDGDIFPAMFREAKLGPLVGRRSWGGVVGITNRGTLLDGGIVNVPEFGFASASGEWTIEGYGVDPDIDVENDPKSVIAGRDPQLERAVAEVMKALETRTPLPGRPAAPDRTQRATPQAPPAGGTTSPRVR